MTLWGLVPPLLSLTVLCRLLVRPPQCPSDPDVPCPKTLAACAASRLSNLVGDSGLIETILGQQLAAL